MTHYLTRLSYSPQSWRHLVEAPHDRREPIADVVEQAGGTLVTVAKDATAVCR